MAAMVIGIDLGGTFIKAAIVDPRGRVLARMKRPTEAAMGKERVVDNVFSIVRALKAVSFSLGGISALGMGIPGVIDFRRGVISTSPNLPGWENIPIRKMLSRRVGMPLYLENDANAAALGEKWMGAAKDVQDFCFITLGTGVGGGLVLDGKIWHGADGMAGEVGHMTIDPDGPRCRCGNRGCLEMYASAKALQRMIRQVLSSGKRSRFFGEIREKEISGDVIYRAAKAGDRVSREAFARMGSALGIGIASLVNLLNLEKVVFGGGLSAAWKFFSPALRGEVKSRAFAAPARRVRIVRAAAGEDAGVLGAAYIAWQGRAGSGPAIR
jgi:glucokinase